MIALFRRYQRAIYFVVTTIIVFSFSFFGTYAANTKGTNVKDDIAVTLVNGDKIYRSQLNKYIHFLSSDPVLTADGSGNPLNSGFLANEFLATPIPALLIEKCGAKSEKELIEKLLKEKKYIPYQHPQAPFVSAMNVWSYFAPQIRDLLISYQKIDSTLPLQDIFKSKIELFKAERSFPSTYLRQIISYQQKQYNWLEPDITLPGKPLSLFGYSSLEDWFGRTFIQNAVTTVLNIARIAEKEGIIVSYDEAKAFLYNTASKYAEKVVQEREKGIAIDSIINQSLVASGLDEHEAVSLVRDTLLFKRALNEIPMHVLATQKPFNRYFEYASQDIDVVTYELPSTLSAKSLRDLVKIQAWIQAVAPKESLGDDGLQLPNKFYTAQEVLKTHPQLVEKRFLVSISAISKQDLLEHIRLRDIWNWVEDDTNWTSITKTYPVLLEYTADTPSHRVRILESLSGEIRKDVDLSIRKSIITQKKDWITDLLAKKAPSISTITIRVQGGQDPLSGITNRLEFIRVLSEAPMGEKSELLSKYTQDEMNYYSIVVLDRSSDLEIVPLNEALVDGTLDSILDVSLEAGYMKLKAEKIKAFQKEDGSTYRDFQEIKDALIERVWSSFISSLKKLEKHLQAKKEMFFIENSNANADGTEEKEMGQKGEIWAKIRFFPYISDLYDSLQNGVDISTHVAVDSNEKEINSDVKQRLDSQPVSLQTEWLLKKSQKTVSLGECLNGTFPRQFQKLFNEQKEPQEKAFLSPVFMDREGTILFGYVEKRGQQPSGGKTFEFAKAISQFIGKEAMLKKARLFMSHIIEKESFVLDDPNQEVH